jgi:hypothetical protein
MKGTCADSDDSLFFANASPLGMENVIDEFSDAINLEAATI